MIGVMERLLIEGKVRCLF